MIVLNICILEAGLYDNFAKVGSKTKKAAPNALNIPFK